jgi:hypothetical protein
VFLKFPVNAGTLVELRRITRPGGLIVVGEPYWIHEPDPAYLASSGMTADLCATIDGNLAIAGEEGLTLLYLQPSRPEDWDRYQFLQLRAAERYAATHPDDPDVPELLKRTHKARHPWRSRAADLVPPAGIEPATHGLGNRFQHTFLGTPSSKIAHGDHASRWATRSAFPRWGQGPDVGGSRRLLCAPLLEGPDQS